MQMALVLEPSQHPIAQLQLPVDQPRADPSLVIPNIPTAVDETSTAIHITSNMDATDPDNSIGDDDRGAGSYVTVIDIG